MTVMASLRGAAATVGIGEAAGGTATGKTAVQLQAEAIKAALDDAGVTKEAIDGLISSSPDAEPHHMWSAFLAEYLGLRLRYSAAVQLGGATAHANLIHAASVLATGQAEMVLVVDGDNRATRFSDKVGAMASQIGRLDSLDPGHEFDAPFGPTVPGMYALLARRHMHEFGTTPEQLAAIAVAARKHGALHPNAQLRKPVTVAEVLASPLIADPIHRDECALVSDWGGAILLATAARARTLRLDPVLVLGWGQAHQGYNPSQAPSLTALPIRDSAREAYAMGGVGPEGIQAAEIYDSFTITALLALEDLGFCEKGEGGRFVEGGRIELGGELPVNTHGGLLSYNGGHSHFLIEGVRQLRGEAGERQVPGARAILSQGTAAMGSSSFTLILGRG